MMLDRDMVLAYAKERKMDPFWLENDYMQHIALSCLYSEFSNELIFKGGTALQKAYGLNRLSRDLDFNFPAELDIGKLDRVAKRMSDYYKTSIGPPTRVKHGVGFRLQILGPSYKATGLPHVLPLTMNLDEKVELKPVFKTINPAITYGDPDLRAYSILVMDEREILAEKVRAVLTRKEAEPRDFYDIWFLLNSGIKFDRRLAERKTEYDKGRFSAALFRRRLSSVKTAWKKDLGQLINPLPDYRAVAAYLAKNMAAPWAKGAK